MGGTYSGADCKEGVTPDLEGPKILEVTTVAVTVKAFLLPLIEHLHRRGYTVDVLANGAAAQLARYCPPIQEPVEAPWTRSPRNMPGLVRGYRQVRGRTQAHAYDLVHVHTPVAAFVTRFALRHRPRGKGPRVVYTVHGFHFFRGGPLLQNMVFLALERLAGRWTDALVVINREDFEAACRYRIVGEDRVHWIPGVGIDLDYYSPAAVGGEQVRRVRCELGLGQGDKLFVMVAEFNPGKRHLDVLRALAHLNRPSVHLALAGDGPAREATKREAKRLGISARVHFLGFQEEIRPLVRAANATVVASEREGLSRAVMESLALEVPVLGSAARGVRDLLEGGGGVIFPVGDWRALAAAMAWVLDHPDDAREAGRRGRELLRDMAAVRVAQRYEQLFATLLQNR